MYRAVGHGVLAAAEESMEHMKGRAWFPGLGVQFGVRRSLRSRQGDAEI